MLHDSGQHGDQHGEAHHASQADVAGGQHDGTHPGTRDDGHLGMQDRAGTRVQPGWWDADDRVTVKIRSWMKRVPGWTPGPRVPGGEFQSAWIYRTNSSRAGLEYQNMYVGAQKALNFIMDRIDEPGRGGEIGWSTVFLRDELAAQIGVAASSAQRILVTLGECGYLIQGEQWTVGTRHGARYQLNTEALPTLRAARRTTGVGRTDAGPGAIPSAANRGPETSSVVIHQRPDRQGGSQGEARGDGQGEARGDPQEGLQGAEPAVSVVVKTDTNKQQQETSGIEDAMLDVIAFDDQVASDWSEHDLAVIRPDIIGMEIDDILETLDLVALCTRARGSSIRSPIAVLRSYLKARTKPGVPKGVQYLSRKQRRMNERNKELEEIEATRQREELMVLEDSLSAGTKRYVEAELKKRVTGNGTVLVRVDEKLEKSIEVTKAMILKELRTLKLIGQPLPER
jgi:hypothetical protein